MVLKVRSVRSAGLAVSLLVVACTAREAPQLTITLTESKTATVEGVVESERARSEVRLALANGLIDVGWAGQAHVVVADGVRREAWETRVGEIVKAIAPLVTGRVTIAANTVDVVGKAPSDLLPSIGQTLESIFGPGYVVRVDIEPILVGSTQVARAPSARTSGTIVYEWTATVFSSGTVAPVIALPENDEAEFAVADGVRCRIGRVERPRTRDANGAELQQIRRELSCEGASIESLAKQGPFIPRGVGCEFRADLPFADRAAMLCGDQFAVRRDGGPSRTLLVTAQATVR